MQTRNKDGTYKSEDIAKYIGKEYGNLKIIEVYLNDNNLKVCKCICKCGKTLEVSLKHLKKGKTKDCGCITKEEEYKKLIGRRFGKLLVVGELPFEDLSHAKYKCLCDCGNYVNVNRYNLFQGTISCGCVHRISTYNDTISKSNTSGVKGVYFEKSSNKWVSKLTIKGKTYKKRFREKEKAIKYRKYLEDYHKDLKTEYNKYKRKKKK